MRPTYEASNRVTISSCQRTRAGLSGRQQRRSRYESQAATTCRVQPRELRSPVFHVQPRHLAEVRQVARNQCRTARQYDGGDLQIHGADPNSGSAQILKLCKCGLVEVHNLNLSVIFKMPSQPPVRFQLLRH